MSTKKREIPERAFGLVPDQHDPRDFLFSDRRPEALAVALPEHVDLTNEHPLAWDQGTLGSCTGHAVAGMIECVRAKQGLDWMNPSRLFLYYHGREAMNTTQIDSGAQLRDVVKGVEKYGVCTEGTWPYGKTYTSTFRLKPDAAAYAEAERFQATEYLRLQGVRVEELKACLAEGFPFVFGTALYDSFFFADKAGRVKMPNLRRERLVGHHALEAVGYWEKQRLIKVRNSWGRRDGDGHGYTWMPYDYVTGLHLSRDFWTIRKVEE